MKQAFSILIAMALASGCGSGGGAGGEGEGEGEGGNVGFGGAQDFGLFRRILEEGGIPGPATLDAAGFFAEHWLMLPPPDCGDEVCLHGLLGVAGNMMNGANCTLLRIGMSTPLDVEDLPALPRNLVVVLDRSGSMAEDDKIVYAREGLKRMVDALGAADRLGIVVYSDEAALLRPLAPIDDRDAVKDLIDSIEPAGSTNFYDGLDLGFSTLAAEADLERQNRVIMVSDGLPTAGLTGTGEILSMAFTWASEGLALTSVGVGTDFGVDLMRSLAEYGAGNFYFADDAAALEEIFVDELATFTRPIAHDVTITVDRGEAYELRETFGTRLTQPTGDGDVRIALPALFLARRESDAGGENGRRGGGGTLLIETLPRPGVAAADPGRVATLTLEYRPADAPAETRTQEIEVRYEPGPGVTPADGAWSEIGASTLDMRKAFVMLNVYAAFRMAAIHADVDGDLDRAYGVLDQVERGVDDWLDEYQDADIASDLDLILRFMINLLDAGARDGEPVMEDPWIAD